jgi:hypothetical protein
MHDGAVKIGTSNVPESRRVELSWIHGGVVLLRYTDPVPFGTSVERGVHSVLAHCRLDGEWFAIGWQEAVAAIESMVLEQSKRRPRWTVLPVRRPVHKKTQAAFDSWVACWGSSALEAAVASEPDKAA